MSGKMPLSDWLKNKLDRLVEMRDIVKKESPEIFSVADPDYGFWSLKKEIALMYWIYSFQQIANRHFDSYYYLDLFAGSGLMEAENVLFPGSPIVAVCSTLKNNKFKKYICMEADETRAEALDKRLKAVCNYYGTCGAEVYRVDCNKELENILKSCCSPGRICYLAFVDPQGIDVNWKTLQTLLSHKTCDVILNFPTSGINRNLPISECAPLLSEFLGNHDWMGKSIEQVLEDYKDQMRNYKHDVHSLEVKNQHGSRLYDLIFATNSMGMKNSLDDLKKRLNDIKTKDISGLYAVVAKVQKQLFDCTQENNIGKS